MDNFENYAHNAFSVYEGQLEEMVLMAWWVVFEMHKKELQRTQQEAAKEMDLLRRDIQEKEKSMREEGTEKLKHQIIKLENEMIHKNSEISYLNDQVSTIKAKLVGLEEDLDTKEDE